MIVQGNSTLLTSLFSFDYEIVLGCNDISETISTLDSLDIMLIRNYSIDDTAKTIAIHPSPSYVNFTYRVRSEEFRDDTSPDRHLSIPDFKNSETFYKLAAKEKAPFKVISDKYSSSRGSLVYGYIYDIEIEMRNSYVDMYSQDGIKNPPRYRKRTADHKVSQYALFEMLSTELLSPASEQRFVEQIRQSSSDDEIIRARNLTRLDELQLGLDAKDLEDFISIRNAVMHFRVVSRQDVERLLHISERFGHARFEKMIRSLGNKG